MADQVDWINLVAKERGCPEGWSWFHAEWKGEGAHSVMLVKGGVPGELFKSGKRKGKPRPDKRTDVRELVITTHDLEGAKVRWERQTGKCSNCCGAGRRAVAFSRQATTYKPCAACRGTGRMPNGPCAPCVGEVVEQGDEVARPVPEADRG